MNIESIKEAYDNQRTYQNTKTRLKRVNTLLRLEPVNVIHTDEYVRNFSQLAHLLMTEIGSHGGILKSKSELVGYIGSISGAVSRANKGFNPLTQLLSRLKLTDIPDQKPTFDAEPWVDTLAKLDNAIARCPNQFGKIVAVCYKHGYVLRVGEIFLTSIKDHETFNYLDMDNLKWYIRFHKNQRRGVREFPVTQEFIDELNLYRGGGHHLLVHKTTYEPYTVQTHGVLELDSLPSNSQIRNSYEEYNWNGSDRTYEEKLNWSVNVLGHSENTVMAHYTSNNVERDLTQLSIPLADRIAAWKPGDPKIKIIIRKRSKSPDTKQGL
jgi:hypothetical protein